ncbi:amino acid permease, partial [Pseudomonas sp. RA_35y_Pfl2_P32]|uniref:amino acid permease n=1 Tax=Pseudomonas sp. RA_35y_Pfl2_P32 TaxID=3088705 RepID=UPI0030DA1DF0
IGWPAIGRLVGLAAVLALPSVVLMMMFGQTRVFFTMARDGLLPAKLASVHPKFRTPHVVTVVTGIGAALAYNFFFLPPLYTLTITDPQNVVTLIVFVIVAVVASQLAGQVRREANLGARTATENAALAAFGQRLAAVADETGTATATCEETAALLGVSTVLL